MSPLRKMFPRLTYSWEIFILAGCFLAFIAMTIWYVTYDVNHAQHVWCHIINTLNNPPPAAKGGGVPNGARQYDQLLAKEFRELKGQLGC